MECFFLARFLRSTAYSGLCHLGCGRSYSSWRKGVFYFQTAQSTRELAIDITLNSKRILGSLDLPEKQERIDLLERLLLEPATDKHNRITILGELGVAYRSIGEIKKAEDVLLDALNSIDDDENLISKKANVLHELGYIYADTGKIEEAIALYQQSLEIEESIGNVEGKAATLAMLGQLLADKKGDFMTALDYLQQSLEILQRIQSPDAETVRGFINDVRQMANG